MRGLIFGNSGSGKSMLARRLGAKHGIPVLDLDDLVWSRTEFAVRRPDGEIARDLDRFVRSNESWVIEGCYGRAMEHLCPHATEMIFLNPGESACVRNCLNRPWEPAKYPTKQQQDAQLVPLLDWVRAYYSRDDDMSLTAHRRLFDCFNGPKREVSANEPNA